MSWSGLALLAHYVGCITLAHPKGLTCCLSQYSGQGLGHIYQLSSLCRCLKWQKSTLIPFFLFGLLFFPPLLSFNFLIFLNFLSLTPHLVAATTFEFFSPHPHLVSHTLPTYFFFFSIFFLPPLSLTFLHTHPSYILPTHIPMSSIEGIPIYQVIIYPRPFDFLPTNHWSRYLPKFPTYLVAATSPVVFLTDLATIENHNKKNKMRILQGIWNCLLKQYLNSRLIFFVNTHMNILHKLKKFKVYAIPSNGYFIYSLDWNIVFRLFLGGYTNFF